MKLWPGAVTRYYTFILGFYPYTVIEGMGSLTLTGTGGRGAILSSRETRRIVQGKRGNHWF